MWNFVAISHTQILIVHQKEDIPRLDQKNGMIFLLLMWWWNKKNLDPTFYQGTDPMNYSQAMKMIIGPPDGGMIILSSLSIW